MSEASLKTTGSLDEAVVYDLAINGDGIDAQLSILNMVLSHRKVDTALIHLYYRKDKNTVSHKNYYKIGTLSDLLQAPFDQNLDDVPNFLYRFEQIYKRISITIDNCTKHPKRCFGATAPIRARSFDPSEPKTVNPTAALLLTKERQKHESVFFKGVRQERYEELLNDRTAYFLKKVLEKAKAQGTNVVFMDIPAAGELQLDHSLVKAIESELKGKFISPTMKELKSLNFDAFGDTRHVNWKGEYFYRNKILTELYDSNVE